ncbi:hypothetical protein ES288_A05G349400v1 [Gossypium darwinii]|uniref:Uncharacterized protein n=1 Tax=Gossypium darwinii TaxID=34276 RepID=A0A5D2GP83_GOSDA|nr:hypothetical protein ES288_A05G349400v1 [Gossypium darwinii]
MSSVSRFSAETSAPDCLDNGVSAIIHGEASCISPDLDSFHSEARENAMVRYKEKKKARLVMCCSGMKDELIVHHGKQEPT